MSRTPENFPKDAINTSVKRWFKPPQDALDITCNLDEYRRLDDTIHRRLFLNGEIFSVEAGDDLYAMSSMCGALVESIMQYNRSDYGLSKEDREPIKLFINSPGGDEAEGFALIAAIETSTTPVYTINLGKWFSMGFLIGIAGHKRFSLPYAQFLLHEGYGGAGGSLGKLSDQVEFDKRFEIEVVRKHVLSHGTMTPEFYDQHQRNELYMLPEDAREYGFIDHIITSLDEIF